MQFDPYYWADDVPNHIGRNYMGEPPKYEYMTEEQYNEHCRKNAAKWLDNFNNKSQSVLVSVDDWNEIVKLVDTLDVNGNIEKLQSIVKKY